MDDLFEGEFSVSELVHHSFDDTVISYYRFLHQPSLAGISVLIILITPLFLVSLM